MFLSTQSSHGGFSPLGASSNTQFSWCYTCQQAIINHHQQVGASKHASLCGWNHVHTHANVYADLDFFLEVYQWKMFRVEECEHRHGK